MKKKGFTLVELLATIVILSVIALIATPIVLNVIEKSKKSALVASANGLIESANMYYTNEIIKGDVTKDTVFDFEEGIQTSDTKLSYKGKVYNGKLILTSSSDVVMCIDDGTYYAYKEQNSDEVISGIGTCLYDGTTGDFTIQSDTDVIIKECDEDKKELQEQINKLTTDVNNLNATINDKDYEISNLEATIDSLNATVTTLQNEKTALQEQLANSNTDNSDLQAQITQLNGTITTLQSSLAAKESEITTLEGEKADLQTALTAKTNELSDLNTKLAKVTATATDVLTGKTILASDGTLVTGTMANKAGSTVTATTVTSDGSYTYVTIPSTGYYNTSSKVKITNEKINTLEYYVQFSSYAARSTIGSNQSNSVEAPALATNGATYVKNSNQSITYTFPSNVSTFRGAMSYPSSYANSFTINGITANNATKSEIVYGYDYYANQSIHMSFYEVNFTPTNTVTIQYSGTETNAISLSGFFN